jgi:hypothetical protein
MANWIRAAGVLPVGMLVWVFARWHRFTPTERPRIGRRIITVVSVAALSISILLLWFLMLVPLLPEPLLSWMSQKTWVSLWGIGLGGAILGGFLGTSTIDGVRDLLGPLAIVLTLVWVFALSLAEPGA